MLPMTEIMRNSDDYLQFTYYEMENSALKKPDLCPLPDLDKMKYFLLTQNLN